LAAAESDGVARSVVGRDWRTGAAAWKLSHGVRDRLFASAFAPDGKTVVTAGVHLDVFLTAAGWVRAWDGRGGKPLWTFADPFGPVYCCAFSPDGKLLALGSGSRSSFVHSPVTAAGRVTIVDVGSGRRIRSFDAHAAAVRSIAYSPDGSILLTGGDDRTAVLWGTTDFAKTAVLTGHNGPVRHVAFRSDGNWVTTADDFEVKVWHAVTGREQRGALPGARRFGIFSPSGKVLATGSDGAIILWSVGDAK
jgi:WD40 repeat protein